MATKASRIEQLTQLIRGSNCEFDTTTGGIQRLNDWFYRNVQAAPGTPGRMASIWYSVAHDIALVLGDAMIERHPHLRWEFYVWGKKNVAYQRHVIMGFSTEDEKSRTNLDVDRSVVVYGHRIVASRGSVPSCGAMEVRGVNIDLDADATRHRGREVEIDAFVQWLQIAARRA